MLLQSGVGNVHAQQHGPLYIGSRIVSLLNVVGHGLNAVPKSSMRPTDKPSALSLAITHGYWHLLCTVWRMLTDSCPSNFKWVS